MREEGQFHHHMGAWGVWKEESQVYSIPGMDAPILIATASLAGVVIVATSALASLIVGIGRGIRQDANEDRRAIQAAMDAFRQEMQRLAERQSHVEGRLDERGSAAN